MTRTERKRLWWRRFARAYINTAPAVEVLRYLRQYYWAMGWKWKQKQY